MPAPLQSSVEATVGASVGATVGATAGARLAAMTGRAPSMPAARRARRRGRRARTLMEAVGGLPASVWLMPLALIATGYAVPLLSKAFVDDVMIAGDRGLVVSLIAGLALAAGLRGGVTWWLRRTLLTVQIDRTWDHSVQVMSAVLGADPSRSAEIGPGEAAAILRGQGQAARVLYGDIIHAVIELPAVPLLFLALAWFDPLIAAIALALTLLNAGGYALVTRRRARVAARLAVHRGRFVERLTRYLSVMPVIKAGGVEAAVLADWTVAHERRGRALLSLGRISERLGVLPGLVSGLSLAVILGVGAWLILAGRMTPGDLVACQSLFFAISDPVRRFIEASGRLEDATAETARRRALTGTAATGDPPPAPAATDEGAPVAGAPALALDGVVLAVDGHRVTVDDVVLEAGRHLAVTGPSGAGKTRLARLVAGLDRPAAGTVRVAGRLVADLPPGRLAATTALVGRELSGMTGRLGDILTLWDDTVAADRIRHALFLAAADDFVGRLPQGLDTAVGPGAGGVDFSGGQWQRLAIARALVPGPTVLGLDEALEALDLGLSLLILDRLAAASITAVVIAHRGETVGRCQAGIDLAAAEMPAVPR